MHNIEQFFSNLRQYDTVMFLSITKPLQLAVAIIQLLQGEKVIIPKQQPKHMGNVRYLLKHRIIAKNLQDKLPTKEQIETDILPSLTTIVNPTNETESDYKK